MDDPAATIGPTTPTSPWGAEPEFRGTFGIILLCFNTLIICTWNTVHFNIPPKRYSDTRRFFLQVSWMVIALYAPEFLFFLAVNERISADTMVKAVLAAYPELTGVGLMKRTWLYICGRVEWIRVSAQCPSVI